MLRPILPSHSRSGVSIVEVMLALVVLAFGLGYLLQLQASTLRRSSEQRMRAQAQLLAFEKAEELRAAPYSALEQVLAQGAKIPADGPASVDLGLAGRPNSKAMGRWFAEVTGPEGEGAMIRIRSVVEWGAAGDAPRSAEQISYAFRPE